MAIQEMQVETANSAASLEDKVNRLITDGWQPQGGISIALVSVNRNVLQYGLLMVKNEPDIKVEVGVDLPTHSFPIELYHYMSHCDLPDDSSDDKRDYLKFALRGYNATFGTKFDAADAIYCYLKWKTRKLNNGEK